MEGFPMTLDALLKTPEGVAAVVMGFIAFIAEMFPQFQALSSVRKRAVMLILCAVFAIGAEAFRALVLEPGMPFATATVYTLFAGAVVLLANQGVHFLANRPGTDMGIMKKSYIALAARTDDEPVFQYRGYPPGVVPPEAEGHFARRADNGD